MGEHSPAIERTACFSRAVRKAPARRGKEAIPLSKVPACSPPASWKSRPPDLSSCAASGEAMRTVAGTAPAVLGDADSLLQTALGGALRDWTRRIIKREQEIPEGSSASEVVLLLTPLL